MGPLFTLFCIPHIDQIYALYRCTLANLDFSPGHESLEVALFEEGEIPWDEIAFPAIRKTLELFFLDRRDGCFRTHTGDILRAPGERYRPIFRVRSV